MILTTSCPCSTSSCFLYHTDEECEIFENACKYLGDTWRTCKLSPTCKLHSLEKHVPWFMKTYMRLILEDNIELLHASNNNYNRALKSIRVWKKRVVTREIRKTLVKLTSLPKQEKLERKVWVGNKRSQNRKKKRRLKMRSVVIRRRDLKISIGFNYCLSSHNLPNLI